MTYRNIETLSWTGGSSGVLKMIDQTLLPAELKEITCRNAETVWDAIKKLRVRGAPAIGIAAAYGVCVGLQTRHHFAGQRGNYPPCPCRTGIFESGGHSPAV